MKFICKWRFGCWHVYSVDRMSRSISCSLQQGFVHLLVVILSSQSKFLCKGPVNGTTSNIPHSAMFEWSNKIIHAYHSWLTHPGIILAFEFCQGANWNLPHSQKLCSSLHSHNRLGCILRVPEWKSLCWHLHTPLASSLGWSQSFGWSATEFNLQVVWCLTCMNTNLDTVPVPDFYRKHEEHEYCTWNILKLWSKKLSRTASQLKTAFASSVQAQALKLWLMHPPIHRVHANGAPVTNIGRPTT